MSHPLRGPREKLERAFGERLFLKGARCASTKCAAVRRPFPPGVHGPGKHARPTPFGLQLREKQKAKVIYGLAERQFRKYFDIASRKTGNTGEILIGMLETRLDNVIYRLGWAPSRRAARQVVSHGHVTVNEHKVKTPSMMVKAGDTIGIRGESKTKKYFDATREYAAKAEVPPWIASYPGEWSAKILGAPQGESLKQAFDPKPIIEFYSR